MNERQPLAVRENDFEYQVKNLTQINERSIIEIFLLNLVSSTSSIRTSSCFVSVSKRTTLY